MSAFDTIFAAGETALRSVHGEPATYKVAGTGTGTSITVIVSTAMPQLIQMSDDGRDNKREIFLNVLVSDVATPKRGDTYTLASASHAGVYTHKNMEKRNGVRWLIAVVKDDIDEMGAEKARQVVQ